MILNIIEHTLDYSIKDKVVYLKLSLLTLFSFLIIPYFAIQGYCYRIIDKQIDNFVNDDEDLPSFNNKNNLILDGLKIFIVNLIYSIAFILLLIFTIDKSIIIIGSEINILILENILLYILLFIVGFLTFLLSKIAIPHMIYKRSFKSAFKISELFEIIKEIKISTYLKFFIIYLIIIMSIFIIVFFIIEGILYSINLKNYLPTNIPFIFLTISLLITLVLTNPLFEIFGSRLIATIYNYRD